MPKIGKIRDCPKCKENSLEYVEHGLWFCWTGGKYYETLEAQIREQPSEWSCGYEEYIEHECPQCGKLNRSGRNGKIVLCIDYGGCGHKYKVVKK